MYKTILRSIDDQNISMKFSDKILIPLNISADLFQMDKNMYTLKITLNSKSVYVRFGNISPNTFTYVPNWVLHNLGINSEKEFQNIIVDLEFVDLDEGNYIKIKSSKNLQDPTKILEHEFLHHKTFFKDKEIIVKMFGEIFIKFIVEEVDNKENNFCQAIRISDQINFDIVYD